MPLINTSVPNLIQGVSQQADATRFAGQCEEQENALSSVVEGLSKRPHTAHVKKLLTGAISANSFVHFVNRSASEKYVVILQGTTLSAYNLSTGVEASINGSTGGYDASSGYLHSSDSNFNLREHIKALTIADNTFLLNTKKSVEQNSTNKTDPVTDKAVVTITQGDYQKTYRVDALRQIAPATVGVTVAPQGVQYKHTFSITNARYAYDKDASGTGTLDYEQIFKIYPKGFSPNHPSALRAEISISQTDYNALSSAQQSFIQGTTTSNSRQITSTNTSQVLNITKLTKTNGDYDLLDGANQPNTEGFVLLDEEFSEWLVEAPRALTPMGTFSINTGTASSASRANTVSIASQLKRPSTDADYNSDADNNTEGLYVDFSVTETRAAMDANFTIRQNGSSLIFSDFPKSGDTFSSYFGTSGSMTTYTPSMGDGDSVEFKVSDGLAGSGISVAHKQTDSISSLPAKCLNNFKIKVIGDAELAEDDYYVKFITNSGVEFGDGAFVETSGSEINQQIDSTTFLHRLILTAENTFSLKSVDPTARNVGDDISNPFPSFVWDGVNTAEKDNFRIQNIFFFKNRLGLLSNDNVIMSESGQPFNFFRTTTLSLLDSAPIDITVASNRVTNLKSAVGFQENLVLFSEGGQFVLKSGGMLTPKTVTISPITNFSFQPEVEPIALGAYIYFPFTRGAFTGLREFTLNGSTDVYDSSEVTEHVPAYIPKNIIAVTGTTTEDVIVLLSSDEPNTLYVYNYFWNNNQKVISSWSKFILPGHVRGMEFIDSTLHLVMTYFDSATHLASLSFEIGKQDVDVLGNSIGFTVHLDKRVPVQISAGSGNIKFLNAAGTAFSSAASDRPYNIVTGDTGYRFVDTLGTIHTPTVTGSTISVPTDSSARTGFFGQPYHMKYKFSTQLFKASSGSSASPSASTEMSVRNGSIFFDETAMFDVKVTPSGRSETTTSFYASTRPDSTKPVNNPNATFSLSSGSFRFPIYCKAKHANIVLENGSVYPSNFNSAEFESFVHPRSNRYG